MIDVVCLDMAGTTVLDGGLVADAFSAALSELEVDDEQERRQMERYVAETMGTSKIEVFRALFPDEATAQRANSAFEAAYGRLVDLGGVAPVPGAVEAIAALRAGGRRVALLTGFSPATRDRLIAALGWEQIADLTLAPAEAGRGRPAPDLVLTAALRLRAERVSSVAVAGDTAADIESGLRAGAGVVAGVLTGSDDAERLRRAGASHVLGSVAELPGLLERLDAAGAAP